MDPLRRMAFTSLLLGVAVTASAQAENKICPDPNTPWLCFDLDRTTFDPGDDVVMSFVDAYGHVAIQCGTSTIWFEHPQFDETAPVIWAQAQAVESDFYMPPVRDALCERRGNLPIQEFVAP